MTREELKHITDLCFTIPMAIRRFGEKKTYHAEEIAEAKRTVMELLEPKAVIYSGDGYADGYMVYDMAACPNCGREFEDGDETWNCNFCPDCGQALKWESEG